MALDVSPVAAETATGRFPIVRPRRLRHHPRLRDLVRQTHLRPDDFILPLFVRNGQGVRAAIGSMPGQDQLSVDLAAMEAASAAALGIPAVLLFGIPDTKDATGSEAWNPDGVVQHAIRAIKQAAPEVLVITDVCFCEYTDHGHCGIISDATGRPDVDNDATLEGLASEAVSHARAGADLVAPSGMIDGMVAAIRGGLDSQGFAHVPIMSYAAKYCSTFYGPFREAAESAPRFGDRRTYQMDPANSDEALREVEQDVAEGADIIMVKPALSYLDVIRRIRDRFSHPIAAYNVSGEYAMIKAAAARGWLDERRTVLEVLTSIKRAGADLIITYFAKDAARWLS